MREETGAQVVRGCFAELVLRNSFVQEISCAL